MRHDATWDLYFSIILFSSSTEPAWPRTLAWCTGPRHRHRSRTRGLAVTRRSWRATSRPAVEDLEETTRDGFGNDRDLGFIPGWTYIV